jgi:hypothetical protein
MYASQVKQMFGRLQRAENMPVKNQIGLVVRHETEWSAVLAPLRYSANLQNDTWGDNG